MSSDLIERAEKCAAEYEDRKNGNQMWMSVPISLNVPEIIRELIKEVGRLKADRDDHKQSRSILATDLKRLADGDEVETALAESVRLKYKPAIDACRKVMDDSWNYGSLMLTPEAKERCRQVVSDFSQKK